MHHRERDTAAWTAMMDRACHEMHMCELGVTITKTNKDHLAVSGP